MTFDGATLKISSFFIGTTLMPNESKNFALTNFGLWIFAALLHPLSQLVPTESGDPPKFFSLLIPLVFVALALVSTALIRKASQANIST